MHKKAAGLLQVRVFYEGKKLCIEVEDDGIGRQRAMELKSRSATVKEAEPGYEGDGRAVGSNQPVIRHECGGGDGGFGGREWGGEGDES